MKRYSRRTTGSVRRNRSSRPSSRRTNGPGVMGREFGTSVRDPRAVTGNEGGDLRGAMATYKRFHKKDPIDVVRTKHEPPRTLVPVGDMQSTMYLTDKWYEDGKDIDYKHRHGKTETVEYKRGTGTIWYTNPRFERADAKLFGTVAPPRKYPAAWGRLGLFTGGFVWRFDDDDKNSRVEVNPKNAWLLSSPDGHMLAVYSPEPQPDGDVGFLGFIIGGKLRVLADGIDG